MNRHFDVKRFNECNKTYIRHNYKSMWRTLIRPNLWTYIRLAVAVLTFCIIKRKFRWDTITGFDIVAFKDHVIKFIPYEDNLVMLGFRNINSYTQCSGGIMYLISCELGRYKRGECCGG